METITSYTPLIKKLFWRVSLPLVFLASLWCFINGLNPLDSMVFQLAFMTAVPMMAVKTYEQQDKTIEVIAEDFRKMGATEFLNFMDEFRKIPLGNFRAIHKEAYRLVYMERYGKDIFHAIPSFGEP